MFYSFERLIVFGDHSRSALEVLSLSPSPRVKVLVLDTGPAERSAATRKVGSGQAELKFISLLIRLTYRLTVLAPHTV